MNTEPSPAQMEELRRRNAEEGFNRLWNQKAIDALLTASGKPLRTSVPPREQFVADMLAANPGVG